MPLVGLPNYYSFAPPFPKTTMSDWPNEFRRPDANPNPFAQPVPRRTISPRSGHHNPNRGHCLKPTSKASIAELLPKITPPRKRNLSIRSGPLKLSFSEPEPTSPPSDRNPRVRLVSPIKSSSNSVPLWFTVTVHENEEERRKRDKRGLVS